MSLSMKKKNNKVRPLGRSLETRADKAFVPLAVDMSGSFSILDLSRFILAGGEREGRRHPFINKMSTDDSSERLRNFSKMNQAKFTCIIFLSIGLEPSEACLVSGMCV